MSKKRNLRVNKKSQKPWLLCISICFLGIAACILLIILSSIIYAWLYQGKSTSETVPILLLIIMFLILVLRYIASHLVMLYRLIFTNEMGVPPNTVDEYNQIVTTIELGRDPNQGGLIDFLMSLMDKWKGKD